MSLVILFAILFQSVDNYEHLVQKLTEKKCSHTENKSNQITHQHHGFENCFVCDFAFSTYLNTGINFFSFRNPFACKNLQLFFVKTTNYFFSGISYSLRGPPSFF